MTFFKLLQCCIDQVLGNALKRIIFAVFSSVSWGLGSDPIPLALIRTRMYYNICDA